MSDKKGTIAIILSIAAIVLSVFTLISAYRLADTAETADTTQNTEIAESAETAETEDAAEAASADNEDIQYVLYLGTNDKDTNEPVFTPEEARKEAEKILIEHFGGYTIQEARGGWIDGDKEYQEYTLVIYLSDTDLEHIHAAADDMVDVFHQSSVLIQANKTVTEFYSGKE